MKKIYFYTLLLGLLAFTACEDEKSPVMELQKASAFEPFSQSDFTFNDENAAAEFPEIKWTAADLSLIHISVEKGDACHVRALQAVTAIGFFKISPLSEPAVSEAEYAFRSAHVIGVKTLFYDVPFVYLDVYKRQHVSFLYHSDVSQFYLSGPGGDDLVPDIVHCGLHAVGHHA